MRTIATFIWLLVFGLLGWALSACAHGQVLFNGGGAGGGGFGAQINPGWFLPPQAGQLPALTRPCSSCPGGGDGGLGNNHLLLWYLLTHNQQQPPVVQPPLFPQQLPAFPNSIPYPTPGPVPPPVGGGIDPALLVLLLSQRNNCPPPFPAQPIILPVPTPTRHRLFGR